MIAQSLDSTEDKISADTDTSTYYQATQHFAKERSRGFSDRRPDVSLRGRPIREFALS